jgi:hypothetical protein
MNYLTGLFFLCLSLLAFVSITTGLFIRRYLPVHVVKNKLRLSLTRGSSFRFTVVDQSRSP